MNGSALTAWARRLSALAEQTRHAADRMRTADGVVWQSTAADRYRERLARESARVVQVAAALDDAAAAMAQHARSIDAAGLP